MKYNDFYGIMYSKLADKCMDIYMHDDDFKDWEEYAENMICKPLPQSYIFPRIELEKSKKPVCDIYFIIGEIPLVSQKAKNALELLLENVADFIPYCEIKDTQYYLVHMRQPQVECVIKDQSTLRWQESVNNYMHDGKPFVIDKSKVPDNIHLFKEEIEDSPFLATQEFVEVVLKNEITGIGFFDPSLGHRCAIFDNCENPVPEVDNFRSIGVRR